MPLVGMVNSEAILAVSHLTLHALVRVSRYTCAMYVLQTEEGQQGRPGTWMTCSYLDDK